MLITSSSTTHRILPQEADRLGRDEDRERLPARSPRFRWLILSESTMRPIFVPDGTHDAADDTANYVPYDPWVRGSYAAAIAEVQARLARRSDQQNPVPTPRPVRRSAPASPRLAG